LDPQDFEPPERHKIPNLRRSGIEKHHHHEWLAPLQHCEHEQCPLNAHDHQCYPSEDQCACNCFVQDCPITKEREDAALKKDMLFAAAGNIR
jgi:hypothetical protein